MPRISAVVITRNEEANIRRCLESVKWASEIVVVDSGSTDLTPDICREYGCRVIIHDWEGYARQKNYAISQASGEWILSLDADEEVPEGLAAEIAKATGFGRHDAYDMPRLNSFLGRWMRHGGWYPDRQLRLFRRGSGEFRDVPLHEQIILHDERAEVGHLAAPLLHYTYPTLADFIRKAERYTDIEAAARVGDGRLPGSLPLAMATAFPRKFAEVYLYKGGWKDGVHGFVAAVLMSMRVFVRYAKIWELGRRKQ